MTVYSGISSGKKNTHLSIINKKFRENCITVQMIGVASVTLGKHQGAKVSQQFSSFQFLHIKVVFTKLFVEYHINNKYFSINAERHYTEVLKS